MGFWLFMTICNLMIPVLMIVIGKVFTKNPPKTINGIYGYRTLRSKKNQDTWDFAHIYCGKLWWKIGWAMLPFSVIGMFPAIEKSDNIVGGVGASSSSNRMCRFDFDDFLCGKGFSKEI